MLALYFVLRSHDNRTFCCPLLEHHGIEDVRFHFYERDIVVEQCVYKSTTEDREGDLCECDS